MVEGEGTLQRRDFAGFLDPAQVLHQAVGGFKPGAGPGLVQCPGKGQTDAPRLQAHASAAAPQQVMQVFGGVAAVDQDAFLIPEPRRRVQIAGVGSQPVPAVGRDDQPARAFIALRIVQFKT